MALAVDGGSPVRTAPLPARHLIGEEEKAAAVALFDAAIASGGVINYGGPEVSPPTHPASVTHTRGPAAFPCAASWRSGPSDVSSP